MLSTLTSKSQITLPNELRKLLELKPGDKIAFSPTQEGQIVVTKANKASFATLRGLLPQPNKAHTIEEMNQAIVEAVVGKTNPPNHAGS
ncbi:MAG: hypothetical protein FD135_3285 [Comamonadaceae bacterium]|nr:MAG: hypothetical protein FD135_3285 [Comamonadaceae bacterium]